MIVHAHNQLLRLTGIFGQELARILTTWPNAARSLCAVASLLVPRRSLIRRFTADRFKNGGCPVVRLAGWLLLDPSLVEVLLCGFMRRFLAASQAMLRTSPALFEQGLSLVQIVAP
jgi:hypothetical protein